MNTENISYIERGPGIDTSIAPHNLERSSLIGGIPEYILSPDSSGRLTLPSGHKIKYDVTSQHIRIYDVDHPIKFCAFVHPNDDDNAMIIGVDVCTKFADGTHHPDFRASQLFAASVFFFRNHNTLPIEQIVGQWGPGSDNWNQYEAAMALLGDSVSTTQERELAAANSTWSGRSANDLGFFATEVSHFGGGHSALFTLGTPTQH